MEELEPVACLGFSGTVNEGVQVLETKEYGRILMYPVGSMVVMKKVKEKKMWFLKGHSHNISCLAISSDGQWLVSGQNQELGVEAAIYLWDIKKIIEENIKKPFPTKKFILHIGKVQALAFSADGLRLASLGGRDDNKLIIWDVKSGEALCGSKAASDSAFALKWLWHRNDRLVTVGKGHVRVWQLNKNLYGVDTVMGKVQRNFLCLAISDNDEFAACGTTTGEVVLIDINRDETSQNLNHPDTKLPRLISISKQRFGQGITAIHFIRHSNLFLAGAGDGTLVSFDTMHTNGKTQLRYLPKWQYKVQGGITSISSTLNCSTTMLEIGTTLGNRYLLPELGSTSPQLRESSHLGIIRDVCFPSKSSELFVSCSESDIRIWGTNKMNEILRIQVPNIQCNCIALSKEGDTIFSGWSDGKIRAFGPESGTILFQVPQAHPSGVSAIAVISQQQIVSGGTDGCVRIWNLSPRRQTLIESMKEHRSSITKLIVHHETNRCLSASKDGSCIIWCLDKYIRLTALFEQTLFLSAAYHPDASQLITAGANGKITFWEAFGTSSEAIRGPIGSENHQVTTLEISANGQFFFSGSNDSALTLWDYNAGIALAQARVHAGPIHALALAPDQSTLVSTGNHAIFQWKIPDHLTSLPSSA